MIKLCAPTGAHQPSAQALSRARDSPAKSWHAPRALTGKRNGWSARASSLRMGSTALRRRLYCARAGARTLFAHSAPTLGRSRPCRLLWPSPGRSPALRVSCSLRAARRSEPSTPTCRSLVISSRHSAPPSSAHLLRRHRRVLARPGRSRLPHRAVLNSETGLFNRRFLFDLRYLVTVATAPRSRSRSSGESGRRERAVWSVCRSAALG